jgi:hypothetical protein
VRGKRIPRSAILIFIMTETLVVLFLVEGLAEALGVFGVPEIS